MWSDPKYGYVGVNLRSVSHGGHNGENLWIGPRSGHFWSDFAGKPNSLGMFELNLLSYSKYGYVGVDLCGDPKGGHVRTTLWIDPNGGSPLIWGNLAGWSIVWPHLE